ncbi:MAG: hypothetical protein ACI8S6_003018 [Myxococcota bacterium]|jgi:hypothetical protein
MASLWFVASWWGTLAVSVLFVIACHLIPERIARIQSMPWTFQVSRSLDLSFQTVTYAAYHRDALSRGSHLSMGPEQVAWFVILFAVDWRLAVGMLAMLTAQAVALREPLFGLLLVVTWGCLAGLGAAIVAMLGSGVWLGAAVFLMAAAAFRTAGHALEPLPPLIVRPTDQFVPLREAGFSPSLLVTLAAGYISEFVSAVPSRLFLVQVYWLVLKLGYQPRHTVSWRDAAETARAVGSEGWRAYPGVADILRQTSLLAEEI